MLRHRCLVKCVGRTRQFDLAVERLVRDAEKSAVRHAEAISIGGDGAAFHVDCNGTRKIDPPPLLRVAQLPVPIVVRDDRSRPQALLEPVTMLAGDDRRRILESDLHLGQCRDRHLRRHQRIEDAVLAEIGVGEHVVANLLGLAQATAVADHQPAVGAQDGQMVRNVLRIGRTDTDIDQRDAFAIRRRQVIGRHLKSVPGARSD